MEQHHPWPRFLPHDPILPHPAAALRTIQPGHPFLVLLAASPPRCQAPFAATRGLPREAERAGSSLATRPTPLVTGLVRVGGLRAQAAARQVAVEGGCDEVVGCGEVGGSVAVFLNEGSIGRSGGGKQARWDGRNEGG